MDIKNLHIDEMDFSDVPTQSQVVNALRDIHRFLSRLGGVLLAAERHTTAEQSVGVLLNGSIQLKAAADLLEQAPNQAGLVHAMPAPPANVRGR